MKIFAILALFIGIVHVSYGKFMNSEELMDLKREIQEEVESDLRDVLNDEQRTGEMKDKPIEETQESIRSDETKSISTENMTMVQYKFLTRMINLMTSTPSKKCSCSEEKSDQWVLQQKNVCFGAKDDAFGTFHINREGALIALKLMHRSGSVSCAASQTHWNSLWGCSAPPNVYYGKNAVGVYVTDTKKEVIFPKGVVEEKGFFKLPGYDANTSTLIFTDFSTPMFATSGQKLQLWYGEDLINYTDDDQNGGLACADIYAKFTSLEIREGQGSLSPKNLPMSPKKLGDIIPLS